MAERMKNNFYNDFLQKENITTLWDVISDEDIFKFLSRDKQAKISEVFLNNIKGFYEIESSKKSSLIEINKKYIILILNYIRNTFPQSIPNKIKIIEEPVLKELITYEEIQNDKRSQFDNDFNRIQEEFTNSMTLPIPEKPDFSDKYTDKPISEMEQMIKEITAKRNYEVEEINRVYQSNVNQADNWLKSQETSVKTEKITPNFLSNTLKPDNFSSNTLKFENLKKDKKNVSWNEEDEIVTETIFNKLKKINTPNIDELNMNDKNHSQNMSLSINELTLEDRIIKIENVLEEYNKKMDLLINLISKKNE
jgi:hypothetical protein